MIDSVVTHVVAVIFLATLIRSALGFGEALVAVPLLALRIPVQVAAPLTVLVSITVAAVVLLQDFRDVQVRSAGWLVLATIAGIPIGLLLLTGLDARLVKALLALVLLVFALYSLASRASFHLREDRIPWLLGCGLVAGVLGGAYGMNGPSLVVYGSLRRWPAERFRATLQAYFLPASVLGMAGYFAAGLWVPLVTRYYLVSLPGTFVAIAIGRALNHRLHGARFLRWAYGGLVVTALALLVQSLAA
ncbi:MAG TPA: sulfite exporter TauE/SafE family protein [Polyangiaceae bacterium]|nr:sulfite exporter TauE/SafE family protein [Polyangiaceae bacterium]